MCKAAIYAQIAWNLALMSAFVSCFVLSMNIQLEYLAIRNENFSIKITFTRETKMKSLPNFWNSPLVFDTIFEGKEFIGFLIFYLNNIWTIM